MALKNNIYIVHTRICSGEGSFSSYEYEMLITNWQL